MRFRRGKKSFGLIAALSCVLTATVAFAAYTGYNYINGTVTVEGNPFKMVFAKSDGTDIADDTIAVDDCAEKIGAVEASDIKVSADGTKIDSFTVGFTADAATEEDNGVMYSFSVRNDGGAPAYLSAVNYDEFEMPAAGDGTHTTGLTVMLHYYDLDGLPHYVAYLQDGAKVEEAAFTLPPDPVPAGQVLKFVLTVVASKEFNPDGPFVWEAVDADGNYGAEIALPELELEWSAVPPASSTT